jgi:hypothetical protein
MCTVPIGKSSKQFRNWNAASAMSKGLISCETSMIRAEE